MQLRLRAEVTSIAKFTDAAKTRTLVQCIGEKIMSWRQGGEGSGTRLCQHSGELSVFQRVATDGWKREMVLADKRTENSKETYLRQLESYLYINGVL